jgi:hypothetical protein
MSGDTHRGSAFTSPHCIEEIANDSRNQPRESGIVQEIVQCLWGR